MPALGNIDSVDDDLGGVLVAPWVDFDLAAEGEGPTGLVGEGGWPDFDGFGVGLTHVYVEVDALESEIAGLGDKHFPVVLLFGFRERWLFGLYLNCGVSNFHKNNTLHHPIESGKVKLPPP